MSCDYQNNCGFYNYLKSTNRLVLGTCGKEEPEDCFRYQAAEGDELIAVQKILQTEDLHGYPELANSQEILIYTSQIK